MGWASFAALLAAYWCWLALRRRLRRTLDASTAVLVTGCDSGFGLAIVKALLKRTDASVVAGAVTEEGLARLRALDKRVIAVKMDVTSDGDVDSAFEALEKSGKTLAGVVNNAGIGVYGWAEALALERYAANIQINLLGVIRVTKKALPLLRQSKGRLVTMGSLGGRVPSAFGSAYVPTKAAVASFQDCVRQEVYRFGVRCSLVEPGFFATGMLHRAAATGTSDCEERKSILAAYGSYAEKMKRTEASVVAAERLNGGERGAERVVDAVLDALLAHFPRTRYLCGLDANLLARVAPFIPDFAWDLLQTYVL
eukprot:TRINITY_DN28402_c0_g1_i1.p1 TRINITY_DN28402_c0_g1~~TRINITY_DN28402_c0_g1_i1.p1  ORF type:complete len:338 (-),score=79.71 TRINITY_DN28402_c0_g1_i1:38-970(-)